MIATYCHDLPQGDNLITGARHTLNHAVSRPVSAALPCPNTVRLWGWEGHCVSVAARRDSCVYPQPHPHRLDSVASGSHKLITEHGTMKIPTVGTPGIAAASARYVPAHYLRRLAYTLVGKATRREALRARAFELVAADRNGGR
jgi:hypothetical protein